MCMEDERIGRKKYSSFRSIEIPASGSFEIAASEKRTHIAFHTVSVAAISLAPDIDTALGTDGAFFLSRANPPLEFDTRIHGDVVQKNWRVSAGPATFFCVLETFLSAE